MMIRQRFGILLMIIFLPINGPLLRMSLNAFNLSLPFGEFSFFTLCIIMFMVGGIMTFTPKLKFESMSKSP
ncbi:MAG: hypothetical protein CND89_01065 [Marine Group II euryarchaeote MED-G38]|nr:hypothetical protein [Euryarchaeota archaeon]PDH23646.1 MAG: hypothetical protein CND89_01065 [Marine Group II euryarchaeote MED-G38]